MALIGGVQSAHAASGSTAAHSATAQCGQGRITVSASMQQVQSVVAGPGDRGRPARRASCGPVSLGEPAVGARGDGRVALELRHRRAARRRRSARTTRASPETTQFTVAAGQYYGVVVQYYWYANSDVGSGLTSAVAQHVDMGGPSNGYCKA